MERWVAWMDAKKHSVGNFMSSLLFSAVLCGDNNNNNNNNKSNFKN